MFICNCNENLLTQMAAVKSDKIQLGARVSRELYNEVRALTEGEGAPFQSLSDYLNYVIAADLGRRKALGTNYNDEDKALALVMKALKNPKVISSLKKTLASK